MINLLPPDVKENVKFAKYNRLTMRLCLYLSAVTVVAISVYAFGYLSLDQRYQSAQKELETQDVSAAVAKTEADAQQLADTISSASTLLKRERRFSDLLKNIASVMPSGASLNSLALTNDPRQPLEIDAKIVNEAQALVLKRNIEEKLDEKGKKLFVGADIQSINSAKIKDQAGETITYTTKITTGFADVPAPTPAPTPVPDAGAKQ